MRTMPSPDDVNTGSVLQGAKLFELFGAFEGSGLPADELHQKIAAIAVNADVPKRLRVEG